MKAVALLSHFVPMGLESVTAKFTNLLLLHFYYYRGEKCDNKSKCWKWLTHTKVSLWNILNDVQYMYLPEKKT